MARSKPKVPEVVITNLDEVDAALLELAQNKRKVIEIDTDLAGQIETLKSVAKQRKDALGKRRKVLETAIGVFATANKETYFKRPRSMKRTWGRIGFQRSRVLKPLSKVTWAKVLEKLIDLKLSPDAIRIKREVNKEVLETWPEDQLKKVGVRWAESDDFYIDQREVVEGDQADAAA